MAEQADEGQADQESQSADGAGEDDNKDDDHATAEVHEEGDNDEGELDGEEAPDLAEVAEVLSVTARKLAGMKLGRKFSGGPRKDTAALKRETQLRSVRRKGALERRPPVSCVWKRGSRAVQHSKGARQLRERGQERGAPDLHGAPCGPRLHRGDRRHHLRHDVHRERGP